MIPYELTFEEREGYLYVRVSAAAIDRESALAYLREVADRCSRTSCSRVVLERDIPVMLSDADLLFTTDDFLGMMQDVRVAFLNPHQPIDDDMAFAMVIANNRGAEFKLHRSLDDAVAWLFS
jgi:hypothetical protein